MNAATNPNGVEPFIALGETRGNTPHKSLQPRRG